MTRTLTATTNPYLDYYRAQLKHQREAGQTLRIGDAAEQPHRSCFCTSCRTDGVQHRFDSVRRFSWAVPDEGALAAIARWAPKGVVEIGAGGGYWAGLLRARGVDVVAYDPDPAGGTEGWHDGTRWSDVLLGDHTSVIGHPDRTLLLVWPSYSLDWTDKVLDLYDGDTVVYVGEGDTGCTGSDRMHQILGLGDGFGCWCSPGSCECSPRETARFSEVESVEVPQWWGIHDRLYVCRRLGGVS